MKTILYPSRHVLLSFEGIHSENLQRLAGLYVFSRAFGEGDSHPCISAPSPINTPMICGRVLDCTYIRNMNPHGRPSAILIYAQTDGVSMETYANSASGDTSEADIDRFMDDYMSTNFRMIMSASDDIENFVMEICDTRRIVSDLDGNYVCAMIRIGHAPPTSACPYEAEAWADTGRKRLLGACTPVRGAPGSSSTYWGKLPEKVCEAMDDVLRARWMEDACLWSDREPEQED